MYQVVNQKNAQAEQNDEYIYQKGDWGLGSRIKGTRETRETRGTRKRRSSGDLEQGRQGVRG
jgi:hypothetical protein